jgi:hypothetical protein
LSEELDVVWQQKINRFDILGIKKFEEEINKKLYFSNSIQNPAKRSRIEETHWSPKYSMEQWRMQIPTGVNTSEQECQHSKEEEKDFTESNKRIDSKTNGDGLRVFWRMTSV